MYSELFNMFFIRQFASGLLLLRFNRKLKYSTASLNVSFIFQFFQCTPWCFGATVKMYRIIQAVKDVQQHVPIREYQRRRCKGDLPIQRLGRRWVLASIKADVMRFLFQQGDLSIQCLGKRWVLASIKTVCHEISVPARWPFNPTYG
jgi:hypothetical protein